MLSNLQQLLGGWWVKSNRRFISRRQTPQIGICNPEAEVLDIRLAVLVL